MGDIAQGDAMKNDGKPSKVSLSGKSVATPDQPMVKVSGELTDADVETVTGGGGPILSTAQLQSVVIALGNFHQGAWAVS
jgi:hypothetical protein